MRYTVFLIDDDFTALESPCTDLIKLDKLTAEGAEHIISMAIERNLDVVIRGCPGEEETNGKGG